MRFDFLFRKVRPSLEQERAEGAQAERLIKDPAFERAVRSVREGIHLKWAESPVSDIEGQTALRLMLKLLDDVEGNLKKEYDSGRLASEQVKQDEKRKRK